VDCEECKTSCYALGVRLEATRAEIKVAYRDLTKVWHPDRFVDDERLRRKADAEMKEINRAYAHLESHTSEPRQALYKENYGATGSAPPAPAKRQHNVIMPQMDESMLEATITKWLKQLGDSVQCGEPLFEVSTEKVDAEILSPAAGVLSEIRFPAGNTVPNNTVIGVISETEATPGTSVSTPAKVPSTGTPDDRLQARVQDAVIYGPRCWRITKILLRSAWRFFKVILTILFGVFVLVGILLGIFMALWRYWELEARREKGHCDSSLLNDRLFSFLESVTWLPRLVWGGLMLVVTPPILGLIFAGEVFGEFASLHRLACMVASCFLGFGILACVFYKEWQAEFAVSPEQKKTTTMSWVMGLVVIIAFTGACSGWTHRHHGTMRGSVLIVGRATRELWVDLAARYLSHLPN
jgi:biotin carboxyl carrier protein